MGRVCLGVIRRVGCDDDDGNDGADDCVDGDGDADATREDYDNGGEF